MSVGVCYNKPHNDLFQRSAFARDVQKVKRQLFGPFDHEETQKFVTEELEKHCILQSERWNFDFENGRPLSPSGIFNWRPVTPAKITKSLKRRPSGEIEFDNHDLYCLPDDIIKPKPLKPSVNEHRTSPHKTQSLITDFMPVKKNSTSETSKKLISRPSKIPRLGMKS